MTMPNVLDIAIVPIWKFRNFGFQREDKDGEPVRSIKYWIIKYLATPKQRQQQKYRRSSSAF